MSCTRAKTYGRAQAELCVWWSVWHNDYVHSRIVLKQQEQLIQLIISCVTLVIDQLFAAFHGCLYSIHWLEITLSKDPKDPYGIVVLILIFLIGYIYRYLYTYVTWQGFAINLGIQYPYIYILYIYIYIHISLYIYIHIYTDISTYFSLGYLDSKSHFIIDLPGRHHRPGDFFPEKTTISSSTGQSMDCPRKKKYIYITGYILSIIDIILAIYK